MHVLIYFRVPSAVGQISLGGPASYSGKLERKFAPGVVTAGGGWANHGMRNLAFWALEGADWLMTRRREILPGQKRFYFLEKTCFFFGLKLCGDFTFACIRFG